MTNSITPHMAMLVDLMKRHAGTGVLNVRSDPMGNPYFHSATRPHIPTGSLLLFTRDYGYYASREISSALYDRCYHLSISFKDFSKKPPLPADFNPALASAWVQAFFEDWQSLVWTNDNNAQRNARIDEVHHYRVFCDHSWQPLDLSSDVPEFAGKWERWQQ